MMIGKTKMMVALFAVGMIVAQAEPLALKSGDTVAFLGDSITQLGAENDFGYVNRVIRALREAGIRINPVYAGVSGDNCHQMMARLEKTVLSKKPDLVFFSDGVNDTPNGIDNPGVPLEDFKKTYAAIVDRILAAGAKVVLLGPTPVVEGEHPANANMPPYAEFVRTFAAERKLPFADMNTLFNRLYARKPDREVREYTVDGTHLNALGNAYFANEVMKTLARASCADERPFFVIDRLENLDRYVMLNPNFATAFKFIREKGWKAAPVRDGKIFIDGEKVFAFVQQASLRPWSQKVAESHRAYIDIQVPLDYAEIYGVGCRQTKARKIRPDDKDAYFTAQDLFPVKVHPGEFAIFFPPDGAHSPCCTDDEVVRVKKLVVKVLAN